MYIARILYPVKVLGPGNRIGIWFNGCMHHCKGCSNPELWEIQERYRVSKETVLDLIKKVSSQYHVDGFTLTGGDPFYQPEALEELLPLLHSINEDILIYTGYEFEDIRDKYPHLVQYASVIIDGKYIEERNNGCLLRGSDNQRIIIADRFKEKYDSYLAIAKNEIQNFTTRDGVISVGIHSKEFDKEIQSLLEERSVHADE